MCEKYFNIVKIKILMYKLQIAVRVLKGRSLVKVIPFKGYMNIKYLYIAGIMFASETAFLLYYFFTLMKISFL